MVRRHELIETSSFNPPLYLFQNISVDMKIRTPTTRPWGKFSGPSNSNIFPHSGGIIPIISSSWKERTQDEGSKVGNCSCQLERLNLGEDWLMIRRWWQPEIRRENELIWSFIPLKNKVFDIQKVVGLGILNDQQYDTQIPKTALFWKSSMFLCCLIWLFEDSWLPEIGHFSSPKSRISTNLHQPLNKKDQYYRGMNLYSFWVTFPTSTSCQWWLSIDLQDETQSNAVDDHILNLGGLHQKDLEAWWVAMCLGRRLGARQPTKHPGRLTAGTYKSPI